MCVTVRSSDNLVGDSLCFILDLFKFPAHEALNGENRILGVSHGLSFCGLTYYTFPALGKSNNRGRCTCAFGVFDDDWFAAFHHGHTGVGGSEVNA